MSTAPQGLWLVSAFADISDERERSVALFNEAAKVFSHPRCANCHPQDGQPRQGDKSKHHQPPVWGGDDGRGVAALECTSCHQNENYRELAMPGAKDWHLAPASMIFLDTSAGKICAGLKDPKRNGNRTLAEVIAHVAHDGFVAWGFNPGVTRNPAPGSQQQLAEILTAWVETGSHCPHDSKQMDIVGSAL